MGRLTNCSSQDPPENHVNVSIFWRPAESPHIALAFPLGKKSFVSHPRLVTTALTDHLSPLGWLRPTRCGATVTQSHLWLALALAQLTLVRVPKMRHHGDDRGFFFFSRPTGHLQRSDDVMRPTRTLCVARTTPDTVKRGGTSSRVMGGSIIHCSFDR